MGKVLIAPGFIFNRKVLSLGVHAKLLFVFALCWCSSHGVRDGRVPEEALSAAAELWGLDIDAAVPELVAAGIFERADNGCRWRDLLGCKLAADNRISHRRAKAKRRAREAGAPIIEPVDRAEIILRDNGICHLCGKQPSEADLTIDHVIPLFRGGSHTKANMRVACRKCNSRKGTRLLAELPAGRGNVGQD